MQTRPAVLLRDDAILLLIAGIWGLAFVAQRAGMEHVGPLAFNGVRFALGSLSLLPLLVLRRAAVRAQRPVGRVVSSGLCLGAVLFAAATLQQAGLVTTSAGKAGFITGLYVVLVPLLGLFFGQRAGWSRWWGALLALGGLYLLSVPGRLGVERGDLLVLAGAVFWAAHVQLVGLFARRVDPVALACIQFAVCSVLSLASAALTETVRWDGLVLALPSILYGGIGSVGVAYTLQVVAQRTAHPTHAAILLSLESVFAVLGGWVLLGETIPARGAVGCGIMLCGMLLSQLGPRRGLKT